ncbi:MAG: RsmF rRNA methyltransferase first C-terminal domain-containing protein [Lachnospiraceae bacterium]
MAAEQHYLELPAAFMKRMQTLLGDEFEAFINSYDNPRVQGLRFNPLKGSPDMMASAYQKRFGLRPVSWCGEGYYYDAGARPGRHPLHEAGAYYIQEPSAMAVAALVDPQPGEVILDLCAAPGGKTSQIGGRLNGQGLLVSNEIHPARARILSQNIERMGIPNAVVTNESPERLKQHFSEFFDKIVVDAPCSGEGMFRKEVQASTEWSEDNVRLCADRQQMILDCAALMLKPGGRLVYSTCTFAPEEDEEEVAGFISRHPEFSIEKVMRPVGLSAGRPEWSRIPCAGLEDTFRIWPHQACGEGHYMAVLKKSGLPKPSDHYQTESFWKDKEGLKLCRAFIQDTLKVDLDLEQLILFGDQVYQLPAQMNRISGLKILRPGLHIGTLKKNRLEPSHALALALRPDQVIRSRNLSSDEPDIINYLTGATLPSEGQQKGWVLICVDGYSTGWAKASAGTLKNHYPKGLRIAAG